MYNYYQRVIKTSSYRQKRDISIRIRLTRKEHDEIVSFTKNSQFSDISKYFRWLDYSFRNKLLIENHGQSEIDNLKEINELKSLLSLQDQESKKVREKINSIYDLLSKNDDHKVNLRLKEQVLAVLEKTSLNPQELSRILAIEESRIYDCLAELIRDKIIDYNNKCEYFIRE